MDGGGGKPIVCNNKLVSDLRYILDVIRGSRDKYESFKIKTVLYAAEYAIMRALEVLEGDKDVNRKRIPDKDDS